jgi:hypothetical protein
MARPIKRNEWKDILDMAGRQSFSFNPSTTSPSQTQWPTPIIPVPVKPIPIIVPIKPIPEPVLRGPPNPDTVRPPPPPYSLPPPSDGVEPRRKYPDDPGIIVPPYRLQRFEIIPVPVKPIPIVGPTRQWDGFIELMRKYHEERLKELSKE